MGREDELLPEAHAKLSVVLNCSRFYLRVYCLPPPTLVFPDRRETAGSVGGSQQQQGVGEQTVLTKRESEVVQDDRMFSMGFW
jgi:hypothetical protein